jgi:hypothetical protein
MPMLAFLRLVAPLCALLLALALGLLARTANRGQVAHDGGVYFVDGDCYARMTRVAEVAQTPWRPVRFHAFENAPVGVTPHTTAPLDWVIVGLAGVMGSRDLAGAWVSPLLGTVLLLFLGGWVWFLQRPYGFALLLVVAVSPILVHGFTFGRPDHQSLILLLVGIALAAELALWTRPHPGWGWLAAVAWALALWTSLFEPLILLLAVLGARAIVRGRAGFFAAKPAGLFLAILLAALLFEGWRASPTGTDGEGFFRWAQSIGELSHPSFRQLLPWTGWLLPVVPVLLLGRFVREKSRPCLALALLVLLTIALTLWYARWGYFLALVFALSLPWAFEKIPFRPVVWTVFLLSLWPMAAEWDRKLFPDARTAAARAEARDEARELRAAAEFLATQPRGVVLAPWWLCPPLAYWSGQSAIAGTSHQSLAGTQVAAEFYLAETPAAAEAQARRRAVRWVVAYEPDRIIGNSAQILGRPAPPRALATALYLQPSAVPPFLHLRYQNRFFKIYEATL